VGKYDAQLKSDDLIAHHLELLYDKMLEANLLKIIHPYRSALVCSSGGSDSSAVVAVCGVAYSSLSWSILCQ
jgi:asparagine synthetase B (glutamine-hydrolysing)